MNKLKIKDLQVEVNNKTILNNLNLEIKSGEIHFIMGPNGSGKSTLSRVIMGDEEYQIKQGDILFNKESILTLTPDERARLGLFLSFQNPLEIEGVSMQDFLRTALTLRDKEYPSFYEFVKQYELLGKKLNMGSDLIHRHLNVSFSGGEKKKNEIFQMNILTPKIIILDEIDSGLDIDSLTIIMKNIKQYLKESKAGLLVITHHPNLLKHLKPDYVHVLVDGEIKEIGDSKLILDIEENGYEKYK